MTTTILALALRILSNPMGNVFQKKLTGAGSHPLMVNFLTFFVLSLVCLAPASQQDWSCVPRQCWAYGITGGVFGAVGNGFLVKALQGGDLSILGPINSYKSVVGVVIGMILLHEMPNWYGLLGILLIIGGSYFVLDTMQERFSWALLRNKQIQYRIWAMVLTAIEATLVKKVINYSGVSVSFYFWCWFGALFSLLLLILFKVRPVRELRQASWRQVPSYACLAGCIGTMQYTTNYVFSHMNVGYALALFQLSTIVSIFLGYKIFQETDIRRKLLGAVIMVIGSVVIILWN